MNNTNLDIEKWPLVSIIIPVYNQERFIACCLKSIINQSFDNLQIIVIDDGSTDKTSSILSEISKMDERVEYIRIQNNGVSHARNVGISHAKGEWITFVDADDYLDKDVLLHIINRYKEGHYEGACIIQFNNYRDYKNCIISDKCSYVSANINIEKLIAKLISESSHDNNELSLPLSGRAVWGKLIKRELIEKSGAKFDEDLYIGEDAMFLLKLLTNMKASQFVTVPEYGYYYRIESSSATKRYKADMYEQAVLQEEVLKRILAEIYDFSDSKLIHDAYVTYLWTAFFSLEDNYRTAVRNGKCSIFQQDKDSYRWLCNHKEFMLSDKVITDYQPKVRNYQLHQHLSNTLKSHDNARAHIILSKCMCITKLLTKWDEKRLKGYVRQRVEGITE